MFLKGKSTEVQVYFLVLLFTPGAWTLKSRLFDSPEIQVLSPQPHMAAKALPALLSLSKSSLQNLNLTLNHRESADFQEAEAKHRLLVPFSL